MVEILIINTLLGIASYPKMHLMKMQNSDYTEYQEFSFMAPWKWYNHLERLCAVSYPAKHSLTYQTQSRFVSRYLSKGLESLCPHRILHMNNQHFIHNCPILEAVKISFSWQMEKTNWHIYRTQYYSVLERNELFNQARRGRTLNACGQEEEASLKRLQETWSRSVGASV